MRILSVFSLSVCSFLFVYSAVASSDIFFSVLASLEKKKARRIERLQQDNQVKNFRKIEDGKTSCFVHKEESGLCFSND
jgi:hypothetical protein